MLPFIVAMVPRGSSILFWQSGRKLHRYWHHCWQMCVVSLHILDNNQQQTIGVNVKNKPPNLTNLSYMLWTWYLLLFTCIKPSLVVFIYLLHFIKNDHQQPAGSGSDTVAFLNRIKPWHPGHHIDNKNFPDTITMPHFLQNNITAFLCNEGACYGP